MTKRDKETTELALAPVASTADRLLSIWSQPIGELLVDPGTDGKLAAVKIVNSPELRAALADAWPDIQRAAVPAGPDGVKEALQPLVIAFKPPKPTEAECAAFMTLFVDPLRMYPLASIREAVREYITTVVYDKWPTVGDLTARTRRIAEKVMRAHYRAKMAMSTPAPPPPPSAEEKAKVAEMMASLNSDMAKARGQDPRTFGPMRPHYGTPHQVAEAIRSAVPAGDR